MLHSGGCRRRPAVVAMRNSVVPYMTMRSPGRCAPTLTDSVHASTDPITTGVPSARPVRAAARAVTVPATSPDQSSSGSSTPPRRRSAHGWYQSRATVSYIGVVWEADRWSIAYEPVRRQASQLAAVNMRRARAHTAGSSSATHASLGPIAWLDSRAPHRRRTASAPSSAWSRSICAAARVSTP